MKVTAHPKAPKRSASKAQPKKILSPIEQALDADSKINSANLQAKEKKFKAQHGKNWRDFVRSGRSFSSVERIDPVSADQEITYKLRDEFGWEWICQNCKVKSFVTLSMIAIWKVMGETIRTDMVKEWEQLAKDTQARGFDPPPKPTPEICPCPNCKFRPGAPE
jgi:hypothetical protein